MRTAHHRHHVCGWMVCMCHCVCDGTHVRISWSMVVLCLYRIILKIEGRARLVRLINHPSFFSTMCVCDGECVMVGVCVGVCALNVSIQGNVPSSWRLSISWGRASRKPPAAFGSLALNGIVGAELWRADEVCVDFIDDSGGWKEHHDRPTHPILLDFLHVHTHQHERGRPMLIRVRVHQVSLESKVVVHVDEWERRCDARGLPLRVHRDRLHFVCPFVWKRFAPTLFQQVVHVIPHGLGGLHFHPSVSFQYIRYDSLWKHVICVQRDERRHREEPQ